MPPEVVQKLTLFISMKAKGFTSEQKKIVKSLEAVSKVTRKTDRFKSFIEGFNKLQKEMVKSNAPAKTITKNLKELIVQTGLFANEEKLFNQEFKKTINQLVRGASAHEKLKKEISSVKRQTTTFINSLDSERIALRKVQVEQKKLKKLTNDETATLKLNRTARKQLKVLLDKERGAREKLLQENKKGLVTGRAFVTQTKTLNKRLLTLRREVARGSKSFLVYSAATQRASSASIRMGGATRGLLRFFSRWRNRLLVLTFAMAGLIRGIQRFITLGAEAEKQTIALEIVATRTGNSVSKVTKAAIELSKDGVLSFQGAAQSLKNLLSTGANIDIVVANLQSMKDAALANGRSMFTAEQNIIAYTQGIKENKSVLADSAGVMKNISVVLKEQADNIKKVGLANAVLIGFTKEAELFSGALSRTLQTLSGQFQIAKIAALQTSIALGEKLIPIAIEIIKLYIEASEKVLVWAKNKENLKNVIDNVIGVIKGVVKGIQGFVSILREIVSPLTLFLSLLRLVGNALGFVDVAAGKLLGVFFALFLSGKIIPKIQSMGKGMFVMATATKGATKASVLFTRVWKSFLPVAAVTAAIFVLSKLIDLIKESGEAALKAETQLRIGIENSEKLFAAQRLTTEARELLEIFKEIKEPIEAGSKEMENLINKTRAAGFVAETELIRKKFKGIRSVGPEGIITEFTEVRRLTGDYISLANGIRFTKEELIAFLSQMEQLVVNSPAIATALGNAKEAMKDFKEISSETATELIKFTQTERESFIAETTLKIQKRTKVITENLNVVNESLKAIKAENRSVRIQIEGRQKLNRTTDAQKEKLKSLIKATEEGSLANQNARKNIQELNKTTTLNNVAIDLLKDKYNEHSDSITQLVINLLDFGIALKATTTLGDEMLKKFDSDNLKDFNTQVDRSINSLNRMRSQIAADASRSAAASERGGLIDSVFGGAGLRQRQATASEKARNDLRIDQLKENLRKQLDALKKSQKKKGILEDEFLKASEKLKTANDKLLEDAESLHQQNLTNIQNEAQKQRAEQLAQHFQKVLDLTLIATIKDRNELRITRRVEASELRRDLNNGVITREEFDKKVVENREKNELREEASRKIRVASIKEAIAAELLVKATLWAAEGAVMIAKAAYIASGGPLNPAAGFIAGGILLAQAALAGGAAVALLNAAGNDRADAAVILSNATAIGSGSGSAFEGREKTITGTIGQPSPSVPTISPNINFIADFINIGTGGIEEAEDALSNVVARGIQNKIDSGEIQIGVA